MFTQALSLAEKKELDFADRCCQDTKRLLRATIIDLVLSTDMSRHFDIITLVKAKVGMGFCWSDFHHSDIAFLAGYRLSIAKMLLICTCMHVVVAFLHSWAIPYSLVCFWTWIRRVTHWSAVVFCISISEWTCTTGIVIKPCVWKRNLHNRQLSAVVVSPPKFALSLPDQAGALWYVACDVYVHFRATGWISGCEVRFHAQYHCSWGSSRGGRGWGATGKQNRHQPAWPLVGTDAFDFSVRFKGMLIWISNGSRLFGSCGKCCSVV